MTSTLADSPLQSSIRTYWNERIHDLEVATSPVGSAAFFRELDAYRFEKLHYLPQLVDFAGYQGKQLLEVGCGTGTDLVRFAQGGAVVTGVDLSSTAIDLARQNFAHASLPARLEVMDGEALAFEDNSFDAVYAHGVIQYTANPGRMIGELYRVLRPGGQAILMVYNQRSWLMALSRFGAVGLEHEDAPAFHLFTIAEFRQLLRPFSQVKIVPERFPVRSRLQHGPKAWFFNWLFVPAFNLLPRAWVRPWGWHLMAFAGKGA
jgi:ubiquinone/menaquinone biosynthesis C-methylase UbiE